MAYQTEAYDFSLFEDRNAARVLEPQIEEQPKRKQSPVELPKRAEQPERQRGKQAKHRLSPLKMAAAALCFIALFATGLTAVYSEVQLTELTEQINDTQNNLAEAESLEVQLNMQAAQRMTDAQVEAYAEQQLGMGKITGSQVVYMHVAQQDKGTVVQDIEGETGIAKFFSDMWAWLTGA